MNSEKLKFGLVFGVLAVVIGASIWLTVKGGGLSFLAKNSPSNSNPTSEIELLKQKSISAGVRKDLLPTTTYAGATEFVRQGDTLGRFQVRGTVISWLESGVKVDAGDKGKIEVNLKNQAQLECLPSMLPSADGSGMVPLKQGYVNWLYKDDLGHSTDLAIIKKKIGVGDQIILMGIKNQTKFEAFVVGGFDCE